MRARRPVRGTGYSLATTARCRERCRQQSSACGGRNKGNGSQLATSRPTRVVSLMTVHWGRHDPHPHSFRCWDTGRPGINPVCEYRRPTDGVNPSSGLFRYADIRMASSQLHPATIALHLESTLLLRSSYRYFDRCRITASLSLRM